jgi:hypothetical protein
VLHEQALDEDPRAADLACGDSARVRKALKGLWVNLQKPCCLFQIQRGCPVLQCSLLRIRC